MPWPDLTKPNRNITRIETAKGSGWWVRINRRPKAISKYFGDTKYSGKRSALKAARNFRDSAENQAPSLGRSRHKLRLPTKGNWKFRYENVTSRGETYRVLFVYAWIRIRPADEKHSGMASTRVSVAKWGEETAIAKAEKWLKKQRKIQRANYESLNSRREQLKGGDYEIGTIDQNVLDFLFGKKKPGQAA